VVGREGGREGEDALVSGLRASYLEQAGRKEANKVEGTKEKMGNVRSRLPSPS